MNKSKKIIFVILLLVILTVIGIVIIALFGSKGASDGSSDKGQSDDNRFTVVTSFYPMYIAALNITDGADINLYNLSEPQTGCLHDYQLTTDDMKLLSSADVFIINGGGMEEFLSDVVSRYPNLKVIDASSGIPAIDDNAHHWMSVAGYIKQVDNITAGLSAYNMVNAHLYQENAEQYKVQLETLLTKIDNSLYGKKVVLFSEAYDYTARDFGLDVVTTLDLDEEKDISARELADTVDIIRKDNVSLIIAEKQYGEKMANAVMKETDAVSVYLDTIIRGDYSKDSYITRMNSNIDMLKEALK